MGTVNTHGLAAIHRRENVDPLITPGDADTTATTQQTSTNVGLVIVHTLTTQQEENINRSRDDAEIVGSSGRILELIIRDSLLSDRLQIQHREFRPHRRWLHEDK